MVGSGAASFLGFDGVGPASLTGFGVGGYGGGRGGEIGEDLGDLSGAGEVGEVVVSDAVSDGRGDVPELMLLC